MSRNQASANTTDNFPLIISVMRGTNNDNSRSQSTSAGTETTSDSGNGSGFYQQSNDTQITVIEREGSGEGERSEMYNNPAANESAITVYHVGSTSAGGK
ncbi:hypothetical protein L486_06596 [Kwoniella mangroviensis CBS 10435]|uniref:Uncharacterized protein n=1 Tax=Kwoniella mangroviensis CBS 10435 TaxID=1331196 RepID=A0A1B9IKC9_9TREE|nr:hypothetical protein L486_06596 [Kwoniella mangroviensis CBS 10435]OCF71663.1 hypothetical protein I204_07723 [Kwoniella mangroviensis CBS 8886]